MAETAAAAPTYQRGLVKMTPVTVTTKLSVRDTPFDTPRSKGPWGCIMESTFLNEDESEHRYWTSRYVRHRQSVGGTSKHVVEDRCPFPSGFGHIHSLSLAFQTPLATMNPIFIWEGKKLDRFFMERKRVITIFPFSFRLCITIHCLCGTNMTDDYRLKLIWRADL